MTQQKKILVAMIGAPGKGSYDSTHYMIEGHPIETTFSFLAITSHYKPDEIYLVGTKNSIWNKIPDDFTYTRVLIENGINEKEHWSIFKVLTSLALDNSQVIFDLTHGFRSLPFICLLSIIYYRAIHPTVVFKNIVYGMHDARNDQNQTPTVDLVDFIKIIDWLYAAKLFTDFGLGSVLSRQIKSLDPKGLDNLASSIDRLTIMLQMIYLDLLPGETKNFEKQLQKLTDFIDDHILPLKLIESHLQKMLKTINQPCSADWERQLSIAEWYYHNRQYAHTIITLRETIITYIDEILHQRIASYEDRDTIGKTILKGKGPGKGIIRQSGLLHLWNEIVRIRNYVGHAQSTDESMDASVTDIQTIGDLLNRSKNLLNDKNTRETLAKLQKDFPPQPPKYTVDDLVKKHNTR